MYGAAARCRQTTSWPWGPSIGPVSECACAEWGERPLRTCDLLLLPPTHPPGCNHLLRLDTAAIATDTSRIIRSGRTGTWCSDTWLCRTCLRWTRSPGAPRTSTGHPTSTSRCLTSRSLSACGRARDPGPSGRIFRWQSLLHETRLSPTVRKRRDVMSAGACDLPLNGCCFLVSLVAGLNSVLCLFMGQVGSESGSGLYPYPSVLLRGYAREKV